MNNSRALRRWLKLFVAGASAVAMTGCYSRLGVGGTGEWRVPRSRLRDIRPLDLAAVSRPREPTTAPTTRGESSQATQPSTAPTTQPQPPREVRMTLADVRRLALENNLDLKVELLNPTIAK